MNLEISEKGDPARYPRDPTEQAESGGGTHQNKISLAQHIGAIVLVIYLLIAVFIILPTVETIECSIWLNSCNHFLVFSGQVLQFQPSFTKTYRYLALPASISFKTLFTSSIFRVSISGWMFSLVTNSKSSSVSLTDPISLK